MAKDAPAQTYQFDVSASEQSDLGAPVARESCRRTLLAAGSVAGLVVLAATGFRHMGSADGRAIGNAKPVAAEDTTIQFPKPSMMCSLPTDDCADTGCCKNNSHTCWRKDSETALCKPDCPDDWDCTDLTKNWEWNAHSPGTSMYCYALIFSTKGGKLSVPDDELLKYQFDNKMSIFACDDYDVFSDVDVSFGSGYSAIKLDSQEEWYKYSREDTDTGAAANAAIFIDAWKVMRGWQKWRDMDWVVKADADSVFIPPRLKDVLAKQLVPDVGVYFENCKGCFSGFFGSLEVISTAGWKIFVDKLENCKAELPWDGAEVDGWKFGPWGEDKFAQECMDKAGVMNLPLFELTYDGLCISDRPKDLPKGTIFHPPCWNSSAPATHPFMDVDAWKKCYDETTSAHKISQ